MKQWQWKPPPHTPHYIPFPYDFVLGLAVCHCHSPPAVLFSKEKLFLSVYNKSKEGISKLIYCMPAHTKSVTTEKVEIAFGIGRKTNYILSVGKMEMLLFGKEREHT